MPFLQLDAPLSLSHMLLVPFWSVCPEEISNLIHHASNIAIQCTVFAGWCSSTVVSQSMISCKCSSPCYCSGKWSQMADEVSRHHSSWPFFPVGLPKVLRVLKGGTSKSTTASQKNEVRSLQHTLITTWMHEEKGQRCINLNGHQVEGRAGH